MDKLSAPVRRKLIEASIPLEKINEQSAREKSIRHGHPSTMHLWWSRKPTATARAVLFSQIVDDPSTRPDLFPTVEEQEEERLELFKLIEEISNWDTVKNDVNGAFDKARQRILLYTGGNPPPVVDPFAGGGSIPLEAQRLGLEAHASDVNPVAVLLEKALIEIPAEFSGQPPIHPDSDSLISSQGQSNEWPGAAGLAEDVRFYGEWMLEEAKKRIGYLYPTATLNDGTEAPVIAWLWARTVTCPNPACGISAPLTSSWWVSKKKGNEHYLLPIMKDGTVTYTVKNGKVGGPSGNTDGTVNRSGARCIACGTSIPFDYIRGEGQDGRIGQQLICTVVSGSRRRIYLSPNSKHEEAANVPHPKDAPTGSLPAQALGFRVQAYGFKNYSDLFSGRQLTALTSFGSLLSGVSERTKADASSRLLKNADAYSDAVVTLLSICLSKLTNTSSCLTTWMKDRGAFREVFSRQAIPMSWDYAECNPLGSHGAGFIENVHKTYLVLMNTSANAKGTASIISAVNAKLSGKVISTDPPYYDYIGYSDLSDFFYVWLRRSLRSIYPELFNRTLVPKSEELVANPFRHGGEKGAQKFFENGFIEFFTHARDGALRDYPVTVYYAFKQQDHSSGRAESSGWETVLEGIIQSGWQITATWPMRTESSGRILANGANALASTIALVLRPRPKDANTTTRADFIRELKASLPNALRDLQKGTIAPVDLPQSAIGPGMALFSKYNGVLESDGKKMTVRAALAIINEILDEVLSEQEGDYDDVTRFALAWFRTYGFDDAEYGNADSLARARNTSVEYLMRSGILHSGRGKVHLYSPAELHSMDQDGTPYDPASDNDVSAWETVIHLAKELEFGNGVEGAGHLLARVPHSIDHDLCKQLAFLLFQISESRADSKIALLFNQLGTSWNDIEEAARTTPSSADSNALF